MKYKSLIHLLVGLLLLGCNPAKETNQAQSTKKIKASEVFDLYTASERRMVYSKLVLDSFKIFSSIPTNYNPEKKYPLIVLLDANAYFEPLLAEIELCTFTQSFPKSIIIGIGYKNFFAMDSLRDRDYTYPAALPEEEFRMSGGAISFKKFIDQELLPELIRTYHVDSTRIALAGHSLGGYFALYYLMNSVGNKNFTITNFVAASPHLEYHHRFLFDLEKSDPLKSESFSSLYVSTGSLENDSTQSENAFLDFKKRIDGRHLEKSRIKFEEFGSFDHMEAAMPGFSKGLLYVLSK